MIMPKNAIVSKVPTPSKPIKGMRITAAVISINDLSIKWTITDEI
jgi:hypothetical protein